MSTKDPVLVSACLAGLTTRYDGRIVACPESRDAIENQTWIPVCPEQLGGLATPRCPADIVGGDGDDVLDGTARVICSDGSDVTDAFISGAHQVLDIARRQSIQKIYLKARSPSCGITKLGVTAALLKRHGHELIEYG